MKKTIRILAVLCTLALLLALTACAEKPAVEESKDLLTQIQERGKLVIATEGDWAPWTYHDENDKLVGFDVELGALIAQGLGVEPEFQETDWDSILAGVDSGRFDIACNGVGYTEERAEKYLFSTPYAYTQKGLVVREDNEDIHTLEDLEGRTTANSPSSTYAALAEEYGATVTSVSTLTETMTLLEQGRVDATINSMVSIQDYLTQHPDAGVKVVQVLEGDPVAYPVQKGEDSQTLIDAINEILDELRESGKLAELSEKYFHLDLTTPE